MDTEEKILQAAIEFLGQGFASHAKISRRYTGKDELIIALFNALSVQYLADMETVINIKKDSVENLKVLFINDINMWEMKPY